MAVAAQRQAEAEAEAAAEEAIGIYLTLSDGPVAK